MYVIRQAILGWDDQAGGRPEGENDPSPSPAPVDPREKLERIRARLR
jgi:hypothetical protein